MVRLAALAAFCLLSIHSVIGAPVSEQPAVEERSINVGSIVQYVCQHLPKALQSAPFCSNALKTIPKTTTVDPLKGITTPFGNASGTVSPDGSVVRFAVKYASAARWQAPVVSTTWTTPNNQASAYPPACPQNGLNYPQSEDCLYLTIYVPVKAVAAGTSLNTFLWIHGGSFNSGYGNDAGLDGSAFAVASGSIVVTVQYRLGVLGWLPPTTISSGVNLGVKDVTAVLTFLNKALSSFGGSANQITVAGQSSGAAMVRALLAAPQAAAQFKNGILHSDPMYYNFLPSSAFKTLQTAYYQALPCTSTTTACITALPLATLLSVQNDLYNNASTLSPAAGAPEPLRPMVDGSFITTSLSGNSFPSTLKPLLITTVKDEAAPTIADNFPDNTPSDWYPLAVDGTFGDSRTSTLLASPWYGTNAVTAQVPQDDQVRVELNLLGTDATWRCPNWSFARSYVGKGGNVHVGRFMVGATYPDNAGVDLCTEDGRVCHEDDIYITFGTTPSPTTAQSTLTKEIQARWSSFIKSSNPNPTNLGYAFWNAATTTDVHALQFGLGGGEADPGACTPTFWGNQVLYDWQIYGVN